MLIASFVPVRREAAGLMYYERDAYLQAVLRNRAIEFDPQDIAAVFDVAVSGGTHRIGLGPYFQASVWLLVTLR